jgi:hypothetical protein
MRRSERKLGGLILASKHDDSAASTFNVQHLRKGLDLVSQEKKDPSLFLFLFLLPPLCGSRMSSQGHRATTGSLPSDYAMLSGYAAQSEAPDGDINANDLIGDSLSHYPRPRNPIMRPVRKQSSTISLPHSERTPLLANTVPRIYEDVVADESSTWLTEYFEELKILSKYTLPVFGYAFQCQYSTSNQAIFFIGHSYSRFYKIA